MKIYRNLTYLWSMTHFDEAAELTTYAEHCISEEVRRGVATLGLVSLLLLGVAAALYALLGFGSAYVYTFSMVAALALHVAISSRGIQTTKMLYLLGMTLLIIAGTAFVLLAHKTGDFSAALLSSTVLLFMFVPLVPWGLREAAAVVVLIYLVFTLSTVSVQGRFDKEVIWLLQFLMLGSAIITLTVVGRNVAVRKSDIKIRFELENARKEMELLSYKDPLTGAWNRRFLEQEYSRIAQRYRTSNHPFHTALLDINNFKQLNDTYGHNYGDIALQRVTQVLMRHFKDDAFIIRLGGDEFMVLYGGIEPEMVMQQVMDTLQFSSGLSHGSDNIPIFISTGLVTIMPQQTVLLEALYKEADRGMYSAKSQSRLTGTQSYVVCRTYPVVCTG